MELGKFIKENVFSDDLFLDHKKLQENKKKFQHLGENVFILGENLDLENIVTIHKANAVGKLRKLVEENGFFMYSCNYDKDTCINNIFYTFNEEKDLKLLISNLDRHGITFNLKQKYHMKDLRGNILIVPKTMKFNEADNLFNVVPVSGSVTVDGNKYEYPEYNLDFSEITKDLINKHPEYKRFIKVGKGLGKC